MIRFSWNVMTTAWLVRMGNVWTNTTDLTIEKDPGESLIIYRVADGSYVVNQTRFPSQYMDQDGFQKVFQKVELLNRNILVDGRPWNGQ